jgi:hypothetical protein
VEIVGKPKKMALDLFTIVGIVGTALMIAAYCRNPEGMAYSGRLAVPAGQSRGRNLGPDFAYNSMVAIIESFWAAISVYGLVKSVRGRLGE